MVLLEAIEFGVPLIAPDVGGIPDIVRDGETGLLVPPGDAGALVDAILRVMEDPAAARERVERGRAHMREHFGLPRVTDRLVRRYERAVAARRGVKADA